MRGPADARELLLCAADVDPDRAYLITAGQADGVERAGVERTLHYGELVGSVAGLARALVAEGVRPGDRVAVAATNSIEWALTAWAATATGRVVVGLNSWWPAEDLLAGIELTSPVVLVVDAARLQRLEPHLSRLAGVRRIWLIGADGDRSHPGSGDPRIAPFPILDPTGVVELPAADLGPDDTATLLFTSGTTGAAKAVIGTHGALAATVRNVAWLGSQYAPTVALVAPDPAAARSGGRPSDGVPSDGGPSVGVMSAPMFHVAGLQWGVMVPVASGGTVILNSGRYDPVRVMELVARHRVTSLGGVPTMMTRLVDHPRVGEFDLTSLTSVSWGGAPPPADLIERCRAVFPRLSMVGTGYGLTETNGLVVYGAGTDLLTRPGTVGKAFPGSGVRVVGPDDAALPAGERGEVQLAGPCVMPGYWQRPDATAQAFTADGWLRTGDLGTLDAEGFLTLTGRSKELIIRGGENVYPVQVEAALTEHPQVLDAAVIGRAHRDLGEEVVAVVQVALADDRGNDRDDDGDDDEVAGVTAEALIAHVAQRVPRFAVPVEITVQTEPLPRNAAGKLIRDMIAGAPGTLTETF
ncbi:MAG: class I adenylate-forming enzyme family protein [Kineosporiaceae bacterium]